MRVALLCSGLGNIYRGHEIFAQDLFSLLKNDLDITLFKGGGESVDKEIVIGNVPRNAACLADVHVAVSPKWEAAVREQERLRIEHETFAYAVMKPLLEGGFDVIHCLEQEVCNIVYANRHLFSKTPSIVFSNGGAIRARDLPQCDFVQEHTAYNLQHSAQGKAFMIPHGVDLALFRPGIQSDFRARHGIPENAFVVITVGTVCYWHKRMDYVIREIAPLNDVYLLVVGQECEDTPEIIALGKQLMGERIIFTKMAHDELPQAYAAANVFVLGSLFETFGIVYIEAMAMGLPVICTQHPNQRLIVNDGIFIDMSKSGALTEALRKADRQKLIALGKRGRAFVEKTYDLNLLREQYIGQYRRMASAGTPLPSYSLKVKLRKNLRNLFKQVKRTIS